MNLPFEANRDLKQYNVRLKDTIKIFTKRLFYVLFDEKHLEEELSFLKKTFIEIADKLSVEEGEAIWNTYKNQFLKVRKKLDLDAIATEQNDPATKTLEEVYLACPGFYAIAIYRLSHELYKLQIPILPRMMSEYAHGILRFV